MTEQPTCALTPFVELFIKHNIQHHNPNESTAVTVAGQEYSLDFISDFLLMVRPCARDGKLIITEYSNRKLLDLTVVISSIVVEVNVVGKTTITFYDPSQIPHCKIETQTFTTDRTVMQGDIVTITNGHYDPKDVDVFVASRDFLMSELLAELNEEFLHVDEMHEIAVDKGYLTKHKRHHAVVTSADNQFMYNGSSYDSDFYISGVSQSTTILVPFNKD